MSQHKTFDEMYDEIQSQYPALGSYLVLAKVVGESGMNREEVTQKFLKHVPKEEYLKSEQDVLIDYLVSIAKPLKSKK